MGIELGAVRDRLALLSECLVGRPFHVRALEGDGPDPDALPPIGDGTSFHLPQECPFPDAKTGWNWFRARLLRQAARYLFGTFAFSLRAADRRGIVLFDGAAEHDALDAATDIEALCEGLAAATGRTPTDVGAVFEMLEMHRTDAALMRLFPGSIGEIERARADGRASLRRDRRTPPAFRWLHAWALGGADRDETADRYGIDPDWLAALDADDASVYTTAELMRELFSASAVPVTLPELVTVGLADADEEAVEPQRAEDLRIVDDQPVSGSAEVQRRIRLERLEVQAGDGPARAGGLAFEADVISGDARRSENDGESGGGGMIQPGGGRAGGKGANPDDVRRRMHGDRAGLRRMFGGVGRAGRSWFYPEWDCHARTYLPDWCQVYEMAAEAADLDEVLRVLHGSADMRREVRAALGQVQPETRVSLSREPDGDEFDLDALVDAQIDVLAGISPDERVYRRRVRAKRDVATAFLVDLSASTDDAVPDPAAPAAARLPEPDEDDPYADIPLPPEPTRRVIDVEREAALLMADALDKLGDACGVYGFSGYGREDVEFHVVKTFREPMGLPVMARFAGLKPRRSTRMGPAIRHAVRKLADEDASLRILMLISDGFPQDCDYGPDRGDAEYGIADTARALAEAESAGIETFCVTVDQAGHDYLRRMCPKDRYVVIDDLARLPAELARAYRDLRHRRR